MLTRKYIEKVSILMAQTGEPKQLDASIFAQKRMAGTSDQVQATCRVCGRTDIVPSHYAWIPSIPCPPKWISTIYCPTCKDWKAHDCADHWEEP